MRRPRVERAVLWGVGSAVLRTLSPSHRGPGRGRAGLLEAAVAKSFEGDSRPHADASCGVLWVLWKLPRRALLDPCSCGSTAPGSCWGLPGGAPFRGPLSSASASRPHPGLPDSRDPGRALGGSLEPRLRPPPPLPPLHLTRDGPRVPPILGGSNGLEPHFWVGGGSETPCQDQDFISDWKAGREGAGGTATTGGPGRQALPVARTREPAPELSCVFVLLPSVIT